jgi:hypothetical protein
LIFGGLTIDQKRKILKTAARGSNLGNGTGVRCFCIKKIIGTTGSFKKLWPGKENIRHEVPCAAENNGLAGSDGACANHRQEQLVVSVPQCVGRTQLRALDAQMGNIFGPFSLRGSLEMGQA